MSVSACTRTMPGYRNDDISSVPQNAVPFIPNVLFQNKGSRKTKGERAIQGSRGECSLKWRQIDSHPTNSVKPVKGTLSVTITSGQIIWQKGRITATAHGRYSGICQVAPVCTTPNTCFLGPIRVNNSHSISIGSAIFCTPRGRVSLYLTMSRPFPFKIAPSHGGSEPPPNTWFLGLMLSPQANSISNGSAASAQLTAECPYTLQWAAHPRQNCSYPCWDLDPHLVHGSFGPAQSWTQIASRSVQPFPQDSLLWQTDRPTNHTTSSVTTGHIYTVSQKKGATLTMAITLPILGRICKILSLL